MWILWLPGAGILAGGRLQPHFADIPYQCTREPQTRGSDSRQ
jgi:hypothetical protein